MSPLSAVPFKTSVHAVKPCRTGLPPPIAIQRLRVLVPPPCAAIITMDITAAFQAAVLQAAQSAALSPVRQAINRIAMACASRVQLAAPGSLDRCPLRAGCHCPAETTSNTALAGRQDGLHKGGDRSGELMLCGPFCWRRQRQRLHAPASVCLSFQRRHRYQVLFKPCTAKPPLLCYRCRPTT